MPRLTDDEVAAALAGLPGWTRDGDTIVKTFELSTFLGAIQFVAEVADLAEAADHHPDIDIRYRRVRLALTTHDDGGLSEKDVALAGAVEGIAGASA